MICPLEVIQPLHVTTVMRTKWAHKCSSRVAEKDRIYTGLKACALPHQVQIQLLPLVNDQLIGNCPMLSLQHSITFQKDNQQFNIKQIILDFIPLEADGVNFVFLVIDTYSSYEFSFLVCSASSIITTNPPSSLIIMGHNYGILHNVFSNQATYCMVKEIDQRLYETKEYLEANDIILLDINPFQNRESIMFNLFLNEKILFQKMRYLIQNYLQ